MKAIHCSKAILDKRRSITSRVQMTIYTHPLRLWNVFQRDRGCKWGSKWNAFNAFLNCLNQDISETCWNEDLHVFEWGPLRVRASTLTCSNNNPHLFERVSSDVRTRTLPHSNEDVYTFERDLDAFFLRAERVCVIPCVWRVLYPWSNTYGTPVQGKSRMLQHF